MALTKGQKDAKELGKRFKAESGTPSNKQKDQVLATPPSAPITREVRDILVARPR